MAGVHIRYNRTAIRQINEDKPLKSHKLLDQNIAILKLFPGITHAYVRSVFQTPGLRAVIMESFGAGNAPITDWLIDELVKAQKKNIVVVNITQCNTGSVEMGRYKTSVHLIDAGVIGGYDITTESVKHENDVSVGHYQFHYHRREFCTSYSGEITVE